MLQYLLSQSEFDAIKNDVENVRISYEKTIQELCTRIADLQPVELEWDEEDEEPEPWGCIITRDDEHYCDECPVDKICPYKYKQYSK